MGSRVGTEDPQRNLAGEQGLADRETKDSKPLAVKYCGGCEGERNSKSHGRVPLESGARVE